MRIDVQGKPFVFPQRCACCGTSASSEVVAPPIKKNRDGAVPLYESTWRVPVCARCGDHVARWLSAPLYGRWFLFIGLGGAFVAMFSARFGGLLLGILIALALRAGARYARRREARRLCHPACAGPGHPVTYLALLRDGAPEARAAGAAM